jgi:putative DNA primase/helicase
LRAKILTASDIILEFESAMRASGIDCPESIVADGKLHRFTPPGDKKGSDSCWYVLHLDHPPSGAFGSWKSGLKENWSIDQKKFGREFSDDEKASLKKRMEADKKRRQTEEKELRDEAKRKANEIWQISKAPPFEHAYLTRKKIENKWARLYRDMLIVEVLNDDGLVGLQFIPEDPEKHKNFLTGTPLKSAAFSIIGGRIEETLIICEGFATAVSLHMATGYPVAAAFSAGNLSAVSKFFRERYQALKIIIAADNDQFTLTPIRNPGLHYGKKAAGEIEGALRYPIFKGGEDGKPTDFNDLHCLYGLEEVKLQIDHGKGSFEEKTTALISESILWERLPDQEPGKKPLATITNLSAALNRAGIIIRYNVIKKEQEILIPGQKASIDNMKEVCVSRVTDLCNRFKIPTGPMDQFLTFLADDNQYNPALTWITSKPWDGRSRLIELFESIKAKGEDHNERAKSLKNTLMRRWLVSAVAAVDRPNGVNAQGVLVFQGDQYIGKTKWFKSLAPQELDLWAEGKTLIPSDRDSVKQVVSYWLVELGEIGATFRKADIEQLKAFVTKDRDTIRMPFAKRESSFVRRTVFFGSVNQKEFLADETGNRRFWVIECEAINPDHGLDMQQVWAEVYDLYKQGEGWHLTNDEVEMLNEHNKDFQMGDPIDEKIMTKYDWERDDLEKCGQWKTATQVLEEIGLERPTRADQNRAATTIRRLNGQKVKRTGAGRFLLIAPERLLIINQHSIETWRQFSPNK